MFLLQYFFFAESFASKTAIFPKPNLLIQRKCEMPNIKKEIPFNFFFFVRFDLNFFGLT